MLTTTMLNLKEHGAIFALYNFQNDATTKKANDDQTYWNVYLQRALLTKTTNIFLYYKSQVPQTFSTAHAF